MLKKCLFLLLLVVNLSSEDFKIKKIRNPFLSIKKDVFSPSNKKKYKKKQDLIYLSGIIKIKDRLGAILTKNQDKRVVFLNDKIWDSIVYQIKMDQVILLKGERKIKLSLI